MIKKIGFVFSLIIFIVAYSVCALAAIDIIDLPNGEIALNTSSIYASSCKTSDGGEVIVELEYDAVTGLPVFYYYKIDSEKNFVVSSKSIYEFPENKTAFGLSVFCDGVEAYLVSNLVKGMSLNSSFNPRYVYNFTNYSILYIAKLDSDGDVVYDSEKQKDYTIVAYDCVADDDFKIVLSVTEEDIETVSVFDYVNGSYDFDKTYLKYMRLNKTDGDALNDFSLYSGFLSEPNLASAGSGNIYLLYTNYSGNYTNETSDIYLTKLNSEGETIISPVKLNWGFVSRPIEQHGSDIVVDSLGDIHVTWLQVAGPANIEDQYWQLKYAKLNSTASVITNKTVVDNDDPLSLFSQYTNLKNDEIHIYLLNRTFYAVGEPGEYFTHQTNLKWINVTTNGDIFNVMDLLDGYNLLGLGSATVTTDKGAGEPCPCGGGNGGNGGDGEDIPEFTTIGIVIALAVSLLGMFFIRNRNKEVRK